MTEKKVDQEIILSPPEPHSKKQRLAMTAFKMPGVREIWIPCGTKWGKAVCIETPILTTTGWKKFGQLVEGDFVFDENGRPTEIQFCTDVMYGRDCFRVEFSDGHSVIADADHVWITSTHSERKCLARVLSKNDPCKSTNKSPQMRTTTDILQTLRVRIAGMSRPNHSIPTVSSPVIFLERDLPLDPYVLGVWLGDGHCSTAQITCADEQILAELKAAGHDAVKNKAKYIYRVVGLMKGLRTLGLSPEKSVPESYLLASPMQRLSLLQGLMDTDGTVDSRGHCTFYNSNRILVDAVDRLAVSLGIKVTRYQKVGRLNGVDHKICYMAKFTTSVPVFRLTRKLNRLKAVSEKTRRRYIVDVVPVPSTPVRCIRVKNPSHLFLVGEGLIPTHNTLAGSGAMIVGGVERPGTKWRWVAPIHDQARIAMEDYFPKILPPEPHRKQNLADLTMKIPAIDVTFEFWHGQSPGSLEGAAVNGYVFDEAAKMKPEIRASARTTTTRTQGPMMFISYPQGKNWFHTGCMEAKEHMEWSLKKGIPPEKIFLHAPTSANPFIDKKVIEDARREIPDRLFRQFYLAEFVDDGQVFIGYRDRLFGPDLDHLYGERQSWIDESAAEAGVVIGVDWAKTVDWTVFVAADIKTRRVIGLERFHKVPYTEAIRRLVMFCKKFKLVLTIRHDKTGVGSAIDDQLAQTNLPYEGVVFTNPSKAEMVTKLMTSFEKEGELYIPRWAVLLHELDSFDVTTNALGTPIYSAPSGKHDDTIAALMLMNTALIDYAERDYQIKFLEDLPSQKPSLLEQFYRELADDADD